MGTGSHIVLNKKNRIHCIICIVDFLLFESTRDHVEKFEKDVVRGDNERSMCCTCPYRDCLDSILFRSMRWFERTISFFILS